MNNQVANLRTQSIINEISRELVYAGSHIHVELIKYTKWNDPKEHFYESVKRVRRTASWLKEEVKDIVAALTVTEDERVILINQYRIPQWRFCIESPAWLCDKDNERLEDAATREILEETWYVPETLMHVWKTPTSSGLTAEVIDCFVWLNCKKVSDILALDNAEDIQVLEIPLTEVDEFIKDVEANTDITVDSKTKFMLAEYRKLKNNL